MTTTTNNKHNGNHNNQQIDHSALLSIHSEVNELLASVQSLRMQTRQLMNQLNTNYITMDKLVKTYHDLDSQYETLIKKFHSSPQTKDSLLTTKNNEISHDIKQKLRDIRSKLNETCTDIVPMTGRFTIQTHTDFTFSLLHVVLLFLLCGD
jgi:predicted transcriptional regulator